MGTSVLHTRTQSLQHSLANSPLIRSFLSPRLGSVVKKLVTSYESNEASENEPNELDIQKDDESGGGMHACLLEDRPHHRLFSSPTTDTQREMDNCFAEALLRQMASFESSRRWHVFSLCIINGRTPSCNSFLSYERKSAPHQSLSSLFPGPWLLPVLCRDKGQLYKDSCPIRINGRAVTD